MSDSVFFATPEAGIVGVHGWDGDAWKKILVSSGDILRIAKSAGANYGDGITPLNFVVDTDEDDNNVMPMIAPLLYNGSTLDRYRGNWRETILASAVRTATIQTASFINYNHRGAMFTLNVTANPGADETLAFNVYHIEPVADGAVVIYFKTGLSQNANRKISFVLYPGAVETVAATYLEAQAIPLPREYQIGIGHSGSGNWTYSVSADYIL